MYIKTHMSSPVITISPTTLVPEAREILKKHHFRHLPVTDSNGILKGIVTDRDIRSAYPSMVLNEAERKEAMLMISKTTVSEIMSKDVQTLAPYDTIDDGLLLLDKLRVGALPVVDKNKKVLGLFSIRDLIAAYRKIFGIGAKGSALVGISSEQEPKIMANIVQILEDHGIPVTRICMADGNNDRENRRIYIRVQTFNVQKVRRLLTEFGFNVLEPPQEWDE